MAVVFSMQVMLCTVLYWQVYDKQRSEKENCGKAANYCYQLLLTLWAIYMTHHTTTVLFVSCPFNTKLVPTICMSVLCNSSLWQETRRERRFYTAQNPGKGVAARNFPCKRHDCLSQQPRDWDLNHIPKMSPEQGAAISVRHPITRKRMDVNVGAAFTMGGPEVDNLQILTCPIVAL